MITITFAADSADSVKTARDQCVGADGAGAIEENAAAVGSAAGA
jgi:hypothetical protein